MTSSPAASWRPMPETFVTVATPTFVMTLNRSRLMELINENLAREQVIAREREAIRAAHNRHLVAALRAQRRNEGAVMRVRRLLALAAIR